MLNAERSEGVRTAGFSFWLDAEQHHKAVRTLKQAKLVEQRMVRIIQFSCAHFDLTPACIQRPDGCKRKSRTK
jgi:hypothetical protein